MTRSTILVFGMMGRTPFAGVAWQVLNYLEGLRRLGHDVFYIEDTGAWPYDPEHDTITDDCQYTLRYIDRLLGWLGMADRWAYRSAVDGTLHGPLGPRVADLLASADALLNLTGATLLREEHLAVPVRIYLETDPVLPQIEIAQGRQFTIDLLDAHTHHASFGENFGAPDCRVPVERYTYIPTRQPIVLDWWMKPSDQHPDKDSDAFTTIANWQQSGKDIEWQGDVFAWSKHHEFLKLIDLPRHTTQPLELALACGDRDVIAMLQDHGWRVADALSISKAIEPYRDYVLRSRGEFTVAKDQNIRLRSGWFSDRSATYLAAGKPVVTQDTGFGNVLPVGRGLFAFATGDQAVDALERIRSDYARHADWAHDIAREYFAAERVLGDLLARVGL